MSTRDRHEDSDAFLTASDESSELAPRFKASDARRLRTLRMDQEHVVQAIAMEARHRREVGCQRRAPTSIELRGEGGESGFGEGLGVFGIHDRPPGKGVSAVPSREEEPRAPRLEADDRRRYEPEDAHTSSAAAVTGCRRPAKPPGARCRGPKTDSVAASVHSD